MPGKMREFWKTDAVKTWQGAPVKAGKAGPGPAADAEAGPAGGDPEAVPVAGSGSGSLGMRNPKPVTKKPINIDPRQIKLPEGDAPVPPVAPKGLTRAEVEQELKKFLEDLAAAQGNTKDKQVRSTDIVWQADSALHYNLPTAMNQYTKSKGDGQLYQPADLARKIAAPLPDVIPEENVKTFRKLKPKDTVLPPQTLPEQLKKKYGEIRDSIVSKAPKSIQKYVKKAIDMAVEKGASYVIEKGLDELNIPKDMKDGVKKALDKYVEQITAEEKKKK